MDTGCLLRTTTCTIESMDKHYSSSDADSESDGDSGLLGPSEPKRINTGVRRAIYSSSRKLGRAARVNHFIVSIPLHVEQSVLIYHEMLSHSHLQPTPSLGVSLQTSK